VAHLAVRRVALVLFFGYVVLLIVAGAGGIVGARLDMPWLLRVHLGDLPHRAQANLLSQYRFLRALELGFGLFALRYRREIFRLRSYNRIFLATMGCGVAARLLSLGADGWPSVWMYAFLAWELAGVVSIFVYTRPRVAAG
jgi:uncharacterized protein DUF4345